MCLKFIRCVSVRLCATAVCVTSDVFFFSKKKQRKQGLTNFNQALLAVKTWKHVNWPTFR